MDTHTPLEKALSPVERKLGSEWSFNTSPDSAELRNAVDMNWVRYAVVVDGLITTHFIIMRKKELCSRTWCKGMASRRIIDYRTRIGSQVSKGCSTFSFDDKFLLDSSFGTW